MRFRFDPHVALVLLAVGCSTRAEPVRSPEPSPPTSPVTTTVAPRPPPAEAQSASPGVTDEAWTSIAEPQPPDVPCEWRPVVRCQRGASSAALPPPFHQCAAEIPASPKLVSRDMKAAKLAPKATRAARAAGGDADLCCYVEWAQGSCAGFE
jgi:hypothetical protein